MGSWTIGWDPEHHLTSEKVKDAVKNEMKVYGHQLNVKQMHVSRMNRYDTWDYVAHVLCDCNDGTKSWTIVYTVCVCENDGEIIGKVMDETVGPAYAEFCPIKYLKYVTAPLNDYSRQWRESVQKAYAEKTVKPSDRRYKVGTEEVSFEQLAKMMGIPACLMEDNRVVKKQKIGCSIIANGIEAYRIA